MVIESALLVVAAVITWRLYKWVSKDFDSWRDLS
jgi:hypothetical protein